MPSSYCAPPHLLFHIFARQGLHWISPLPCLMHIVEITEGKPRESDKCQAVLVKGELKHRQMCTLPLPHLHLLEMCPAVLHQSPSGGSGDTWMGVGFVVSMSQRDENGSGWLRRGPTKTTYLLICALNSLLCWVHRTFSPLRPSMSVEAACIFFLHMSASLSRSCIQNEKRLRQHFQARQQGRVAFAHKTTLRNFSACKIIGAGK